MLIKICDVCGATENETDVINSKKHNGLYCKRHYNQLYQYGKILKRTKYDPNEIIKHDNYAEVVLYDIDNEEKARTKIDLEDVDNIKDYKWSLTNKGYVYNHQLGVIHRLIMNCPDDKQIDHINHDKLDNRKENLRICTNRQNNMNKGLYSHNTSGYTGVSWDKEKSKWEASIKVKGVKKHLGYFGTKDDAVDRRKKAEEKYFGEFRYDYKKTRR